MKLRHFFHFFIVFVLFFPKLIAQYPLTVFHRGGSLCDTRPYELVFEDDFDGHSLDTSKWLTYFPYGPNGSDQCSFCRTHSTDSNEEGQIFKDENLRVSDGKLYIDIKKEKASWYQFTENYTSGFIFSKQAFNTYSKYEIRCKIAIGKGLWPAFWMFGWSTEIDVFEFYQSPDEFETSVHYWGNDTKQFHQKYRPTVDLSKDFHTYAVTYDQYFVTFFLDDKPIAIYPRYYSRNDEPLTNCYLPKGIYKHHQDYPQYGNPLNIICGVGIFHKESLKLQATETSMEVDYIRVYQHKSTTEINK